MKINNYSVMLNENRVPYLKLDSSVEYQIESELNNSALIVKMVNNIFNLEYCAEEHLITIAMDTKWHVLGVFQTSHGEIAATEASARCILQRALLCGAATFIVVHNHPSGDCTPSQEDIKAAERLKEAGALMQIPMSDFIIVGNGNYFSYFEMRNVA